MKASKFINGLTRRLTESLEINTDIPSVTMGSTEEE
jgi:hypothetical protein